MIYIIASRFDQAKLLANRLRLYSHCWTWINEHVRLFGLAPGTIVFKLETATDLPNYADIMRVCHERDFQVLNISLDRLLGVRR